jgi:hypothetical protein
MAREVNQSESARRSWVMVKKVRVWVVTVPLGSTIRQQTTTVFL